MTTELALDFCREVIGWQDAAPHHSGEFSIRQFAHQSGGRFYHSSLDDVLQRVVNWCDEHDKPIKLTYSDGKYGASISMGFDSFHDDPKIALMEVCLRAERDRAQNHKVMP